MLTAIDENRMRSIVRARFNHLRCDHRSFRVGVAKIQQRGQTVRFDGAAFEFPVSELQVTQLVSQLEIFGVGAVERDVAAPDVADFPERPRSGAPRRSDHVCRPIADQSARRGRA